MQPAHTGRKYLGRLTASVNRKGVLDIDTVKGCAMGMAKRPHGGCYGLCYAAKLARAYGHDFATSVSREFAVDGAQVMMPFICGDVGSNEIYRLCAGHLLTWFRIGTMGDPSHDWPLTVDLCRWLAPVRTPVIVTKHWIQATDDQLVKLASMWCVFNTSVSALDDADELDYRLAQHDRLSAHGCRSVLRIVSCLFGDTSEGRRMAGIQARLFDMGRAIDTPLRIPLTDARVVGGTILASSVHGETISKLNVETYTGHCAACPDQCGVAF